LKKRHMLYLVPLLWAVSISGCASSKVDLDTEQIRRRSKEALGELEGGETRGASQPTTRRSSQSTTRGSNQSATRPYWIEMPPQDESSYYGVGGPAEGWDPARAQALNQLAQGIEVKVVSEVRSMEMARERRVGKGRVEEIESEFQQEIKLLATQVITDYQLVDQWREEGKYWILLKLEKQKVRDKLQKELDDARKLALDHYRAGVAEEREQRIGGALKSHLRGMAAIRKFLGLPVEAVFQGRNILLNNEIERSVRDLLGGVEIAAQSPNRRKVRVGQPLSAPLVVQASYQDNPLGNMPLQFEFIKGMGELEKKVRTDVRGQAACRVFKVTTEEPANVVEAHLDLEELVGQEENQVEGVRQTLARIGGGQARFFISTQEKRVMIRIEEENLGTVVSDSYLENFLKKQIAGQMKGIFSETVQDADLLLEGSASSRLFTKKGEINWCYATVTVRLQDLKTGEELYSTKLDRVKGYHLEKEEAGRRAIEKAAGLVYKELSTHLKREINP